MLHHQRQFELEKSQGRFLTSRQRMALQRKLALLSHSPNPSPPPAHKFEARRAQISADKFKDGCPSLDGVPTDIRQLIFRFAEQSIKESKHDWKLKQTTQYDSLKLVSKQFYHDLQEMHWQHWLIRKHQTAYLFELPFFSGQFGLTRPDRASPLFKKFSSLSIEIPFGTASSTLQSMTLAFLALPLEELKLYFSGCDTHDTPTKLGFCGLKAKQTAGKLPVDGQDFRRRAILLNSIGRLSNLETLVVSNANMPVTPNQVVNNKPRLKRLAIVCDPRTTVTDGWASVLNDDSDQDMQYAAAGSTVQLDSKGMPALEELELTANSMLMPSRLVREAMHTLKKLTWTVPNIKNQSDGLPDWHLNWLSQTGEILLVGAMNGALHGLQTLRICIEQQLRHPDPSRTDRNEVGELCYSLNSHLKRMVNLRNLELHIDMGCGWLDPGMDMVTNLGSQLARLYISEKMIQSQHLRLISCLTWDNLWTWVYMPTRLSWPSEDREAKREDTIRICKELAFLGYEFAINGVVYRVLETSEDQPIMHDGIHEPTEDGEQAEDEDANNHDDSLAIDEEGLDIVNETLLRESDRDVLRTRMREKYCSTAKVDIELLRLNGRLLDRERNKHLCWPADSAQISLHPEEEQPVQPGVRPARRFPVVVAVAAAAGSAGHWMCEFG